MGRLIPGDGRFAAAAVLHAAGLLPAMRVVEIGARRPAGETGFNEVLRVLCECVCVSVCVCVCVCV